MKITIEHEGVIVSCEDDQAVDIYEAIECVQRVLLAAGFHPDSVNCGFLQKAEEIEFAGEKPKETTPYREGDE